MTYRAANAYKRADLETAPKTVIVERLFDRFATDVAAAKTAITAKDIHAKAAAIDHALRIVVELKASLDHAAAPEMCANLEALYNFVTARLSEANAKLVTGPLDQAARVMADVGEAFREAHAK
jgi:flagellar secretion chaperone FliS